MALESIQEITNEIKAIEVVDAVVVVASNGIVQFDEEEYTG